MWGRSCMASFHCEVEEEVLAVVQVEDESGWIRRGGWW